MCTTVAGPTLLYTSFSGFFSSLAQIGKLAEWSLALRSPLSLFRLALDFSLVFLHFFFSLKTVHVAFFSCLACSFLLEIYISMATNNHRTQSPLGCLKSSLLTQLIPNFNLVSCKFFIKGRKKPHSLPNIARMIFRPRTNILLL